MKARCSVKVFARLVTIMCLLGAGCEAVGVHIQEPSKPDEVVPATPGTAEQSIVKANLAQLHIMLTQFENRRLAYKTAYANYMAEIDTAVEEIKRRIKEQETENTQKWLRFWAGLMLLAAVVVVILSFRLMLFKTTLRTLAFIFAGLGVSLFIWAQIAPYVPYILMGILAVGIGWVIYWAIVHHETLAEAFRITSRVADKVPQAVKETAFVEELSKAEILNRDTLKKLRDELRPGETKPS